MDEVDMGHRICGCWSLMGRAALIGRNVHTSRCIGTYPGRSRRRLIFGHHG